MGSLITALQNQNIAAANQETLGDIYAANPTNLGYTDNPFGYTAAPAVIQTAYPKYGYNATAPVMPPSYEDYDLTTLFSMLQSMQAPQQDGQAQSFTAPVPTVAPMMDPMFEKASKDAWDRQMVPAMTEVQAPATPAGILAQLAGEVQQQTGQTTPVPGAYTVPGTEPVVAEEEDTQAASDERIRQLIAENAAEQQRRELEQRYKRTTGLVVNPNQSSFELRQVLDDPSSPYNVTE